MAVLPVDYTDSTTPTGATTEYPATTTRGLNATHTQINTNTTNISESSGAGMLPPVRVYVTGAETFTVASGTVTQIAGTTIQGVSPAVGDRILITSAPASTGVGGNFGHTNNPGNGIYVVTNNTTNLSVSRATDMSGTANPIGRKVFSSTGSGWLGAAEFTVTVPTSGAFTWGTTALTWAPTGGVAPAFNGLITAGSGMAVNSNIYPLSTNANDLGTSSALFRHLYSTDIELGNASDTTLARASAGHISVEGNNVLVGSINGNTSQQSQVTVANTAYYITASDLAVPTNLVVGSRFRWTFTLVKTAAGTGTFNIRIYRGTAGSTADTADVTQAVTAAATAVADAMTVDVDVVITTTGATGAYYWSIVPSNRVSATTGFATSSAFSGTVSSVALNTASLKFGLSFINVTGTPTITVPMVRSNSYI